MGELLICNEPIAAMPYYIEGISWNIYSLEELCYYVEQNTYLLEKDFMTEELCTWISREVNNVKLAEKLREIMHMDGRLSEFVSAILVECGYCPNDSIKEVVRILQEMEQKSDFECNKVRADQLMDKEKYLSSIYAYRRLLNSNEAGEQSRELIGNIWHNLGTAYARLFLFGEAVNCYEKAYRYNKNKESLKESLVAQCCLYEGNEMEETAQKYAVEEVLLEEVQKEITKEQNCEAVKKFENKLEEIAVMNNSSQRAEYHKAIGEIIFNWKEEYRRICRV